MYYAYLIENILTKTYYVGITVNPTERWTRHKSNSRSTSAHPRYHSYLYEAMRKYGYENFTFEILKEFTSKEDCEQFEVATIQWFEDTGIATYNLHEGGTSGYNMQLSSRYNEWKQNIANNSIGNAKGTKAYDDWKAKIREARKGRTPALGMSHSEENKKLFKQVSANYWSTQDTYTKDAEQILQLSHREAKKQFGISTTHYYRLKKRFTTNESE